MRLSEWGPLPVTLIFSITVAVLLVAGRIFFLHRARREQRQESERLRALLAIYRTLAGSFTPNVAADNRQIEEALSDLVLFGNLPEIELALPCIHTLLRGEPVRCQPLIELLRTDLRQQLGLEALPATLQIPPSGPARPQRGAGRAGGGPGGGPGGLGRTSSLE
jgi:hypothetical protein